MLIKEADLPKQAYCRPFFFKALHKGSDIYDVELLPFVTCKSNIIKQYILPGVTGSNPTVDMISACDDWPDLARCSGYSIPTLTDPGY